VFLLPALIVVGHGYADIRRSSEIRRTSEIVSSHLIRVTVTPLESTFLVTDTYISGRQPKANEREDTHYPEFFFLFSARPTGEGSRVVGSRPLL